MTRVYVGFVFFSSLIGAQIATGLHRNGWDWTGAAAVGVGLTLLAWAVFFGQLWWAKRPRGPLTRRGARRRRDRALRDTENLWLAGKIDAADYRTRLAHLRQWDGRP